MSRLEEDGEECGDDEVGEPVERLADRHQSVLRVDRHDLRDDETFDVAHADREADDDEDHRDDLTYEAGGCHVRRVVAIQGRCAPAGWT